MKLKKPTGAPPCDELREGDGIDPRYLDKNNINKRQNFQDKRLCRQIEKALIYLVSGGLDDDRFEGLFVESVKPDPDMSLLRVTVIPLTGDPLPDPDEIQFFLESVKGCMKNEIAREISRKRVPDFRFCVRIDPDKFLKH